MSIGQFFMGTPERTEQLPSVTPELAQYLQQIISQLGGPTSDVFKYISDLFSDDPEAFERFAAPARREFQEQTIPGIAERFTGMGAGAQSSSAFQQQLGAAGAGLSERLQAMREGLKGQGISALQGMQQIGMTPQFGYQTTAAQPGFLQNLLGPLMQAGGTALGGNLGRARPG